MLSSLKPLWFALLRLIIYGVILLGVAQLLFLDAYRAVDGGKFTEASYTEWTQALFLLLTNIVIFWTGRISPKDRVATIGLNGFFLMALIREFDYYLDTYVFDGAWQLLAYTTMAITLILLYRKRNEIPAAVTKVVQTPAFGFMSTGILITFFFSRLYGRSEFWMAIMEEKYIRNVKNASEESIELLGYTLILIGAIELFRVLINQRTSD